MNVPAIAIASGSVQQTITMVGRQVDTVASHMSVKVFPLTEPMNDHLGSTPFRGAGGHRLE